MKPLPMALRMSLGLASLAVSVLCLLHSFGVMPDSTEAILRGRAALCETLAIACSSAAIRNDSAMIETMTRAIVQRNPDVLYAAVHGENGKVPVEAAKPGPQPRSAPIEAQVPIYHGKERWGTVLVRFKPLSGFKGLPIVENPSFRFIALCTLGLFISNVLYLYLVLKRERSRAGGIPERVRATLDTLVEGVLLMDLDRRIALVNESFARTVGKSASELEGRTAGELSWAVPEGRESKGDLPWANAIERGSPELGSIVALKTTGNGLRTLSVNSTPIIADDGSCHGILATFDDLTGIERKNLQLHRLLEKLKQSRSEVRRQNETLRDLATLDPLTTCLNRRAYFERFQVLWDNAQRHGHALCCLMLDIDHFKSINDRHGHGVGDRALQEVAGVLKSLARTGDLVCRYGGEEFCVALPYAGLEGATEAAERFRQAIESKSFAGISVTASFGVAALGQGADDTHALLNQADKALYAAKRTGRNRVIRSDQIPADLPPETPRHAPAPAVESTTSEADVPVPYHAVTALISALAYRDPDTATHCRRVADLCVTVARGLVSERECYELEIAALLHDIGKLAVPDAILRKPGPLSEQEWQIMATHDRVSSEIIATAFAPGPLGEIIRTHHAWYTGNPRSPGLPTGDAIPLGARLLSIADAYDAMVSDRVYRQAIGREAAFVELRRCAGVQFDPTLVERFVASVLVGDRRTMTPVPSISKRTAFKIGLQIEKLVDALDAKDGGKLVTMATRLRATATEHRIPPIVATAAQLEQAVTSGGDWLETVKLTGDLLELCRSTQNSFLDMWQYSNP